MFLAIAPFWQAFILFFVFVPLLLLWLTALVHLIMRGNISAVARVVWLLVIVVLPIFGPAIYFLSRPVDRVGVAAPTDQPGAALVADEISKLAKLRDAGVITEDEASQGRRRSCSPEHHRSSTMTTYLGRAVAFARWSIAMRFLILC
jgi:CBS domain containing-hemolysin-like protein